jgi:hypothetical protein
VASLTPTCQWQVGAQRNSRVFLSFSKKHPLTLKLISVPHVNYGWAQTCNWQVGAKVAKTTKCPTCHLFKNFYFYPIMKNYEMIKNQRNNSNLIHENFIFNLFKKVGLVARGDAWREHARYLVG